MSPPEQYDLSKLAHDNQQKPFTSDFGDTGSTYYDIASPPYQSLFNGANFQLEDIKKASPFASLGIVKDFASRSRNSNGEKIHIPCCSNQPRETNDLKMSTNARIRMAGQHFIDSYSSKSDEISELIHPFSVSLSGLSGLSDDEAKDIKLLVTLLASAEKTDQRQFDRASKLIELCTKMSSSEGNAVERLVYYFSEAIREKINREMGGVPFDVLEKMKNFDLQKALMNVDTSIFAFHKKVPLSQVCQFSAMHTIIEHTKEAKKVHVIDLEIRTGMHYTILMQALASRSELHIEQLRITAIGTRLESKIKDTCNQLVEFAKSMNIPFSFKIVMVEDMLDFNINLLELNDDEKVAVYSPFLLSSLIAKSNRLEHLMREIRKINPCITLITEVEANHTSPNFVNRFIEALFFYGAFFDCMSDCFADNDFNRKVSESVFYGQAVLNIVAADGNERTIRHIGVNVWRSFFERFGMMEIGLSDACLNEVKLLIDDFECRDSCMLHVDDGCFLVGWKGVLIFSISAWEFV